MLSVSKDDLLRGSRIMVEKSFARGDRKNYMVLKDKGFIWQRKKKRNSSREAAWAKGKAENTCIRGLMRK